MAQRWRAAIHKPHAAKAGLPERAADILSGILNIASEGIVVTDSELRVLLFSKGAEQIFGYRAAEIVGRSLDMLIPEPHRSGHGEHVRRFANGAVQSRIMNGRSEVSGLAKDGRAIPLEIGLSKLATPQGLIFTAMVRDVSERRTVEAALGEAAARANAANDAKSVFLAAMSHEIRTPLNGVLGMAQAMARDELSPKQRERLLVVRQSGESLLAILNDLLDLSKIEAGKLTLEDTEFDLGELAEGALATFGALAAQKGLAFDLDLSARASGVYRGDPLRVRQILHNLISNAIKFTAVGGVRIAIARPSGKLTLAVSDTGIGIPADKLAGLFQKFEQVDASTTRHFGGTGLGLAICRDLAEMMGGKISATSSPGKGTAFRVSLPLPRVSGPLRRREEAADASCLGSEVESLRVLVAEDNGTNQLVIETLLNQAGIRPVFVNDGHGAVAAWEEAPWDIILMDVQMPNMDGPTATSVIRSREAAEGRPRAPILALTANVMDHQALEYRQAGMDGVVAKPIEVEKLFAAIASVAYAPPLA